MSITQWHSSDLTTKIHEIRQLMIAAGTNKGLGNQETLRYSEELDKLIIQVQLRDRFSHSHT